MSILANIPVYGWLAIVAGVALSITVSSLLRPGLRTVPRDRIRQLSGKKRRKPRTTLAAATGIATDQLGKLITRTNIGLAYKLELAGVRWRANDIALMTLAASLTVGALGLVFINGIVGMVFGIMVPVAGWVLLSFLIGHRRKAFQNQLDSGLMMMAASLRAGYSLMQSVQSMGKESDSPTKDEFARVINETRIGRNLSDSLLDVATRMASEDFGWVTEAISINREVGGNLADVFDGVAKTIRDRNQLHRTVDALAAEGKLSAVILVCLPIAMTAFLSFSSPGYLVPMFTTTVGWILLAVAAGLLIGGSLWMRAAVKIKF